MNNKIAIISTLLLAYQAFAVPLAVAFYSVVSRAQITNYNMTIPDTLVALNATGTPGGNSLSTLLSLASARQGLVTGLSSQQPLTVFAPTNNAFKTFVDSNPGLDLNGDLVTQTLAFHTTPNYAYHPDANMPFTLLPSGQPPLVSIILTNGTDTSIQYANMSYAKVIETLSCSNGVIHVIDNVLALPANISTTAQHISSLSQLVGALNAANLTVPVDVLPSTTVFAPLDSAFDAINATVKSLNTTQLSAVLTYHVVTSTAFSTYLKDGDTLNTVNGQTLKVALQNGKFVIVGAGSNATIVTGNVQTRNGVIHIIDTVLLPQL
ncbi:hypothetical protein SeLEV6574_g00779 [Synchytrium endobioticum]|nr:hypothetical protein SeLEV6574_g00779 [Synchytrium endobioticum]